MRICDEFGTLTRRNQAHVRVKVMNVHLGTALKDARDNRNLKQHELADLLGVSASTISKVEHGNRPLRAIEFLTLGLIFPNWFEMQANDLVTDLTADLATRLQAFLATRKFGPLEYQKRDWLHDRLAQMERGAGEIA